MAINFLRNGTLALALATASTGVALAAVIYDDAGSGFVGKGDIQLLPELDWNNRTLQECANSTNLFGKSASGCLAFRLASSTVTETTWTCSRTGPQGQEQTQERLRTTTTTFEGVVAATARVKNQVTGFNLNGFDGEPTEETETDGPPLGSCPNNWTASAQETTETSGDAMLEVHAYGYHDDWIELPKTQ